MNKIYETKPPNLKILSKCPTPPSVNIVSIETKEAHVVFRPGAKYEVNPKEIMTHVASYMKDTFEKCGIAVDKDSSKSIYLSMGSATISDTVFATRRTWFTLNVLIPEKNYLANIGYVEASPRTNMFQILAMSVHGAVWKTIKDPRIQDYILCKSDLNYPNKIKIVAVKGYGVCSGMGTNSSAIVVERLTKECNGKSQCDFIISVREPPYCSEYIAEWQCGNDSILFQIPSNQDGPAVIVNLSCP